MPFNCESLGQATFFNLADLVERGLLQGGAARSVISVAANLGGKPAKYLWKTNTKTRHIDAIRTATSRIL
jgi:hypothetical protein